MTHSSFQHRVGAMCLFAATCLFMLPASAAQISVPLTGVSSNVDFDANGGLSTPGISSTGNVRFGDLSFGVAPLDNPLFDSIVAGSAPVRTTLTFKGTLAGESATLTTTNTFTDPSVLGPFFGSNVDPSRVLSLGSGSLSGAYTATLSDVFFNLTAKDVQNGQLDTATGNILMNASGLGLPGNNFSFSFSDVQGSATFAQVTDVAEPGQLGLLGLAILGLGLIWRRKQSAPLP